MGNADVLITGLNNVLDKKAQELGKKPKRIECHYEQFHKASVSMEYDLE
jgi:phospholipid/cholesterol/gamma-HCH transport system substrate-binding protein